MQARDEDRIQMDHGLSIPELVFRRFRGEENFPATVGIMSACNEVDRLEYNELGQGRCPRV